MSSKLDYLRKYMGGGNGAEAEEKKKKKKKSRKRSRQAPQTRILDEDEAIEATLRPSVEEEEEEWKNVGIADDAPVVLGDTTEGSSLGRVRRGEAGGMWSTVGAAGTEAASSEHDDRGGAGQGAIRRRRADSDASDATPPRRRRADSDASDSSPPRRRADSAASDASPPRRRADSNASDASPPRRGRADSDGGDASPPRRGRADSKGSDASPPRRGAQGPGKGESGEERATRMSSGQRAGLHTGASFKEEQQRVEARQRREMERSDPSLLGRNAMTVMRDRDGKQVGSVEEEMRKRLQKEGKLSNEEEARLQREWNMGKRQKEEEEKRREEFAKVAAAPVARHKDDPELEAMQRGQMRADDPMAHFFEEREAKVEEQQARSGGPVRRRYRGPQPPPTRFPEVKPGYRWDGVDRGNGFEAQWLGKRANEADRKLKQHHNDSYDM